jgi:hypothetical protein
MDEKLFGGTMAFSESKEACLFVRSNQGPWGYSGQYEFKDDALRVRVEVSIADDLEGTTIERTVRFLNENELVFSGLEAHTDRLFETIFYRV